MMLSVLNKEEIKTIFESAEDILSTIGIEFEMEDARALFQKNGARIEGKRVFISPELLADTLKLMPEYKYEPVNKKRLAGISPFCNSPMILDDTTGIMRQGTVEDAVKMYQLGETSDVYEAANPGVVDPAGNDCEDQYVSQIAMMLKYSDKYPNLGLRATKSNTKDGDVYTSAKKAIQLIKEIKGEGDGPVMGQGICPMAPLGYDEESLINLKVLVEEEQDVTLFPCTLSFMTGPESLLGVVTHDVAICLAGIVYVQLLKPGTPVGLSCFSTMSDMKTMQPVYASPEYLYVQIMFYEVCLSYGMNCGLCGCMADGTKNDYQSGSESSLTSLAPYFMTEVEDIWCYPGHMAAFAGGSFHKMIFDEEMMINCNRTLQGLNLSFDPKLKEKLSKAVDTKSFLTIGDVSIYRKEQRVTPVFDKKGIDQSDSGSQNLSYLNADKIIEKRLASYVLPERTEKQKALLQEYLPTQCRY
jgi:trimethylamine--corrinoid protein Co-methyltransferase